MYRARSIGFLRLILEKYQLIAQRLIPEVAFRFHLRKKNSHSISRKKSQSPKNSGEFDWGFQRSKIPSSQLRDRGYFGDFSGSKIPKPHPHWGFFTGDFWGFQIPDPYPRGFLDLAENEKSSSLIPGMGPHGDLGYPKIPSRSHLWQIRID